MARMNARATKKKLVEVKPALVTHEGAKAKKISDVQQLRRTVMSCMLWEDSFYEDGKSVADRIAALVKKIDDAQALSEIAIEARTKMKLRHVPLLIAVEMAKHKNTKVGLASVVDQIIQRPDEITELLAIYEKQNGRVKGEKKLNKLSKQLQKGIASAFNKFNEYELAKWNQSGAIKLRDALFLSHAKPERGQKALFKRLAQNELATPDTWEVALSASKGENKKKVWENLLKEKKLGALALLRNLRNFENEGVSKTLVKEAFENIKTDRVLPFRFLTAARHAPGYEPQLESAMFKCLEGGEKLLGRTVLLIDHSGSMTGSVSSKSEVTRSDAAIGLGIILREICEDVEVVAFHGSQIPIPARRGFALRDEIMKHGMGGTDIQGAINFVKKKYEYDRLIVLTDEQSATDVTATPGANVKGYFINVAAYQNGVGYGKWVHIDGWSESVVDYIRAYENTKD